MTTTSTPSATYAPPAPGQGTPDPGVSGSVQVEQSILTRAKHGDKGAISTMFRQFVDPEETIQYVEYLGRRGFITGQHSFGCLTQRRVASIIVGSFGEVIYSDGYLEEINSSVFYQPSLLKLYALIGVIILGTLYVAVSLSIVIGGVGVVLALVLGGLLTFYAPSLYYRMSKSGLVFIVREGVSVYMFTNRGKLAKANALWRIAANSRDARLRFAHP